MKFFLLFALVASAAAAAIEEKPADEIIAEEKNVEEKTVQWWPGHHGGDWDHGHHGKDSYCCYKVKKELTEDIDDFKASVGGIANEMRARIKSNLNKLVQMEKKVEEREEIDVGALQTEVLDLTAVIGDVDDDVKNFKGQATKRFNRLAADVARIEERVEDDEKDFAERLANQRIDVANLTLEVGGLSRDAAEVKVILGEAAEDRSEMRNATATLDGRLGHVGQMTMRAFADVDERIGGVTARLDDVVCRQDAAANATAALAERTSVVEWGIVGLANQTETNADGLERLRENLVDAAKQVQGAIMHHNARLKELKDGAIMMEKAVDSLNAEAAGSSKGVAANAAAVEALKGVVAAQGAQIEANGKVASGLAEELKQLRGSFDALRQDMLQHRDNIVEEMKKLTQAVAA